MISPKKIKKARVELEESQAVFGQRFGVDQSTIHRWENENPPRGTALKLLEQFFATQGATNEQ
jgi:DNA-binding transcriptional regulator YiaG